MSIYGSEPWLSGFWLPTIHWYTMYMLPKVPARAIFENRKKDRLDRSFVIGIYTSVLKCQKQNSDSHRLESFTSGIGKKLTSESGSTNLVPYGTRYQKLKVTYISRLCW